jgi:hypothetical protein
VETSRHSETCQIKQVNSNKIVEAVVHEFKEQSKLVVVLNKSVKLNMVWNGRVYEGKMAGMDFTSSGPKISKYTTGTRG